MVFILLTYGGWSEAAYISGEVRDARRYIPRALVTSIEGFRAIAARTGNYRPDENEPSFIVEDALKADTNPAGLVSCAVRVWQWFPIAGVARWEEFAPVKTVWVDNQPTDRKVLDKSGRWGDMPLMLAKCAEAQAIRKGWPEDLGNTFVGEEIEQASQPIFICRRSASNSKATGSCRALHLKSDNLRTRAYSH
jgi:phage recombination protein Bet